MPSLKETLANGPKVIRSSKGKSFYGRKIRSSGAPPSRHKRKVFFEGPQNRCAKHHAYRAGCGCGK